MPPWYSRARSWGAYDGGLREAVHALKFGGRLGLAHPLGALMAGVASADPVLRDVQAIVPVPLHPRRLRQRGFNQAEALARVVGRLLGVRVASGVLRRMRHTPPQTELSAAERAANILGAFTVAGSTVWERALLVDDVMSTGSTASECARVLKQAGVGDVAVLTLARATREALTPSVPKEGGWPRGVPDALPGPGGWR